MNKWIYIAGKISGTNKRDALNKFNAAKKLLEYNGFIPFNPMEISTRKVKWNTIMRQCVSALMKCDHLYLLKDWQDSEGALIEKAIAERLGIRIIMEEKNRLFKIKEYQDEDK